MSMQSVDDYDPNSSKPIFGSGVTQTKVQQQQQLNNDTDGNEKLSTPELNKNGQNDVSNDNKLGNGTTESKNGETNTHVNGQNGKIDVVTVPPANATSNDNVNPAEETISASGAPDPIEKAIQNDPTPVSSDEQPSDSVAPKAPTDPEPALSTTADAGKQQLSSATVTTTDNPPPSSSTELTSVPSSNDNVPASATAPEATVLAESTTTPERQSKSPRGKTKSPVVSTPPTRQSTRGRKPAATTSSSSQNDEEQKATDDANTSISTQPESLSTPKRGKRQAATSATDASQAGTSTPEKVDDSTNKNVVPSEVNNDDDNADVTDSKSKRKTSSPRKGAQTSASAGRKRGASSSPSVSPSKKAKVSPKGKASSATNDEQQMDVDNTVASAAEPTTTTTTTTGGELTQTPPKKARTSGTRKTPKSASTTPETNEEYVRKLRPRK